MLNGLLCPVQQEPAQQIVDTDLRTLIEQHIANLFMNTETKEKFSRVALVWSRLKRFSRLD